MKPSSSALALSLAIVPLAALASGLGLLAPGLYRDPAWLVPQARGQDLVTLLASAVMLWALHAARRGSTRAHKYVFAHCRESRPLAAAGEEEVSP